MNKDRYIQIACPRCGKAYPLRIIELRGTLRYSILCRNCKEVSEVEIKNTQSLEDIK